MNPTLWQFGLLPPSEQRERVRKLAAAGWKARDIASLTGLHIDQVLHALETAALAAAAAHAVGTTTDDSVDKPDDLGAERGRREQ